MYKWKHYGALLFLLVLSQIVFFALAAAKNITPQKAASTGLPVLYVETVDAKSIKSKSDYRKAVYSMEGNSGRCRIRGRGNTTWKTREFVKKPYLLKLDDAAPLCGMEAARKWVLIANTADKTALRNAYAFYLASEVFDGNIAAPKCAFVQLFLNGRYNGLYLLTEKSDFDDNRLRGYGDAKSGSFIAEARSRMGKEVNFKTREGVPFSLRSPKVRDIMGGLTEKQTMDYCLSIVQKAEDSIYSPLNLSAPAQGGADWEGGKRVGDAVSRGLLDLASFVDWYWVNELTRNHDAHFQSSCFVVWDAVRSRLFMGPVWDFDISCGNISSDDCENPEGLWICERYWFYALMQYDKTFQLAVWSRWQEKRQLAADSLLWLEREASRLEKAIELDESVYPKIGRRQWPHPPKWQERKTYRAELDYMEDFLRARIEWLDGEAARQLEAGG